MIRQTPFMDSHGLRQPGTQPIPNGVTTFILQLTNAAAGLNDANRVQNEVAAMSLARDALRNQPTQLIPAVYGWGSAADGPQGWILQDLKPGCPLSREFNAISFEDKKAVLAQMAHVFGLLQQCQILDSIKEYGGVDFDWSGNIISAPMTLVNGGPFPTYEACYKGIRQSKLAEADGNSD
ncbi:hypothetical protein LTR28_009277 [Elasticomyces elasticus]|nr:hypothetical protein LTR28_009277 [Elasticomyces elasticus]